MKAVNWDSWKISLVYKGGPTILNLISLQELVDSWADTALLLWQHRPFLYPCLIISQAMLYIKICMILNTTRAL